MKTKIAALFIASATLAATAQVGPQQTHNFGKAEFIGTVDGYENGDTKKILGKNIWQNSIQIAGSSKRIPIAYTIDDKGRLNDVWVGDAGGGKENVEDTLWLQEQGYDKEALFKAIDKNLT